MSIFDTQHLLDIMASMTECKHFATKLQKELVLDIDDNVLSDLINVQEQVSLSCYIKCLFRFYSETQYDVENRFKIADSQLIPICSEAVKSYMASVRELNRSHSETRKEMLKRLNRSKIPLIKLILDSFAQLSRDLLSSKISFIYPVCCDLSVSDSFLLRKSLRDLFLRLGNIKIEQFQYEVVKIDTSSIEKLNEPEIQRSRTQIEVSEESIQESDKLKEENTNGEKIQ